MKRFRELLLFLLLLVGYSWGLTETPDPLVPETNGPVYAIVQHEGMVYVGGYFSSIGGVSIRSLAAFNAQTGKVDEFWNPQIDVNGPVHSLFVYDNKIYAGGHFTTVNESITRNHLAAFELANGSNTGLVDPAWDPDLGEVVGSDLGEAVSDITSDGTYIYVGGDFRIVNSSISRKFIAAFEPANGSNTGLVVSDWDPHIESDGSYTPGVHSLSIVNNTIYAGGRFTHVNNTIPRNSLAAFELAGNGRTGDTDLSWDPNLYLTIAYTGYKQGIANTLNSDSNYLYVGGTFDQVNGSIERNGIAAFELANGSNSGNTDPYWNPNIEGGIWGPMPGNIYDLSIIDTKIFIAGQFYKVNETVTRNNIAAFDIANNSNTGIVLSWNPDITLSYNNIGVKVVVRSGNGIITGGDIAEVGGEEHKYLVGFDSSVQISSSVDIWELY